MSFLHFPTALGLASVIASYTLLRGGVAAIHAPDQFFELATASTSGTAGVDASTWLFVSLPSDRHSLSSPIHHPIQPGSAKTNKC